MEEQGICLVIVDINPDNIFVMAIPATEEHIEKLSKINSCYLNTTDLTEEQENILDEYMASDMADEYTIELETFSTPLNVKGIYKIGILL